MKKIIFALFIFLLALFPLYSLTIDEILESANSVSYTVKNATLTHQNSILLLEQNDLEDSASWNVDLSVTPFKSAKFSDESLNISKLSASVVLPNDGSTTITASSPIEIGYNGSLYLAPSVSASHTFDFNYFDDDQISDLDNARSRISTERVYYNSLYSFNKSVISLVSNLLNLEKSILTLEHNISNAERDLNNMIALRDANENSITYKRSLMELDRNRRSLTNYQDQYEKAKEQFKVSTGLEWTTIDDFSLPELKLSQMENGNSEVLEHSLSAESASLSVVQKERAMDPLSLKLTGSAGVSYRNNKSRDNYLSTNLSTRSWTNNVNGSIDAALNISNWTIGSTFSASAKRDFEITPALTIYGSWHNNTAKESDRLELERLRNTAISEQNDYLDSLTNYNIEGMRLANEVMNYSFTLSNMEENEEYLKAVLESEREYFESGLVREDDVKDAEFEYEVARYDRLITYLDGLSLYYDLLIYSL